MNIYTQALDIAQKNNQVTGEENDFYLTLEQLNYLLMKARDE